MFFLCDLVVDNVDVDEVAKGVKRNDMASGTLYFCNINQMSPNYNNL